MFFTDLSEPNIMDKDPFLTIDITAIRDVEVEELKKFHKSYFQVEAITSAASDLKYTNLIKAIFNNELKSPSEPFVKFFVAQVYQGRVTEKVLAQFIDLVKKSTQQVISDLITDRFKTALSQEEDSVKTTKENTNELIQQAEQSKSDENKIQTTKEELEGYYIVKSILRSKVAVSRIGYRDQQSYFGILLDDNNRKPICRLYFNRSKKYIAFFDENKKEQKIEISAIDDIYQHAALLEKIIDI